jgi:hypothetical protein
MTHARLAHMRQTAEPRCCNCGWWAGRDGTASVAQCEAHAMRTLDLAVCTTWREHEVFTGEIVKDDEGMTFEDYVLRNRATD